MKGSDFFHVKTCYDVPEKYKFRSEVKVSGRVKFTPIWRNQLEVRGSYTGHRFSMPTADLSQAERRTVTKYSRPLISSVH